jgi:elongation factor Ts
MENIKKLRAATGLGMMACKKALDEAKGDVDKAIDILRKKGAIKAAQRAERAATEGIVGSYIHSNGKIGVLAEVNCETDFVARNQDFVDFVNDVCMHIAAMNPKYISPEEADSSSIEKEKEIYREQLKAEGKPEAMIEKIIEGKVKKFAEQGALLKQPFVKNPSQTIEEMMVEMNNKLGENIQIARFTRYQISK